MKKKFFAITSLLTTALLPLLVHADDAFVEIKDPLNIGAGGPSELYGRLAGAFVAALGAVALFFFIQGGMLWLISGGNEEKIKKGKETIVWATLGMATILGSYFILSYIINIITTATGNR